MRVLYAISGLRADGAKLFLERLTLGLAGRDFGRIIVQLRNRVGIHLERAGIHAYA